MARKRTKRFGSNEARHKDRLSTTFSEAKRYLALANEAVSHRKCNTALNRLIAADTFHAQASAHADSIGSRLPSQDQYWQDLEVTRGRFRKACLINRK